MKKKHLKDKSRIFTLISIFIILFIGNVRAKKTIDVFDITTEVQVVNDISPNQAKKTALNEAKIEALRKAGIGESVSSQELLFKSEINNDFTDFFSSSTQIEIKGAIQSYEITSEKLYCKAQTEEIYYSITINAKVVKYSSSADPAFDAKIEGVNPIYLHNTNLKFSLRSTLDCHLLIFSIGDKETSLLFPSLYEESFEIKALEEYKFPISKINYTMFLDSGNMETNRLVFLFTKKKLNYINVKKGGLTSREDLFSFIYSIPPDVRKIEYLTYIITKPK